MILPDCVHRHDVTEHDCGCGSDRLIHPGRVPLRVCPRCPYADQPNLNIRGAGDVVHRATHATGISRLAHAIENLTGIECGCGKRLRMLNEWFSFGTDKHRSLSGTWAVGVTTANRTEPTLHACLASVVRNGWAPWLFAEPGADLTGCSMFQTTRNQEVKGAWKNWLQCAETLLKETDAEWILTVQDDAEFVDGAREWVEQHPVPSESVGVASLYACSRYHKPRLNGWHKVGILKGLLGACAMAFPRDVLRRVVESPHATGYSRHKRIDKRVGKIIRNLGLEAWVTEPSLCQHIARHSTIGNGTNVGIMRAASVGLPEP